MSLHKEISFETELVTHLGSHGWLYAEGDAAGYDRARALFPADVLAWVQATQPIAWTWLTQKHGAAAGEIVLTRLREVQDQQGTLEVLRRGIECGVVWPPMCECQHTGVSLRGVLGIKTSRPGE